MALGPDQPPIQSVRGGVGWGGGILSVDKPA